MKAGEENPKFIHCYFRTSHLFIGKGSSTPTAENKMVASHKSSSFSEHGTNLSDVVVDMEEGFFRSHNRGTEDYSDLYSIRSGRVFTKKSSMKGAHHMQIEGDCKDGEVILIPAPISGAIKAEKSSDPIVGAAPDHHHLNVGIAGHKPMLVVSRSHSGRTSLHWILRPRRFIFLFATLSSMGTMILIYLTLLISKDNNPKM